MKLPLLLGILLLAAFTGTARANDDEVASKPALDEGRLRRAQSLLDEGKFEAARDLFSELKDTSSLDGRIHFGLGRVLAKMGEYAEAVDELLAASDLLPGNYDVLHLLGETLFLQGQDAAWNADYETAGYAMIDARRMFEQAAELRPGEAAPWLGAARAERARGEAQEAQRLVEKALEIDPKHTGSLIELGSLRFGEIVAAKNARNDAGAERARSAAREPYEKALDLEPDNAYAMNGIAWILKSANDTEAAITWFHKSLLSNPTLTDGYDNLAELLSGKAEEKKRLVELLDGVVGAASRYASGDERRLARAVALYRRGVAKAAVRDFEGLDKDLAEAAKADSRMKPACDYERAVGFYRDNQYAQAATILARMAQEDLDVLVSTISSQRSPSDAALMVRSIGDRCYRENDLDGAREMFHVAAETLVDSADDWNNYAFFARESGRYEESLQAYERAIAIDGSNPNYLNDTALILHYHLHRDLDYAAELYERAIEEGNRLLEDPGADSFRKQNAKIAVRDASNNLALLRRGASRKGSGG